MKKIELVKLFGIPIARLKLNDITNIILELIEKPGQQTIFYVNAHCLNIATRDPIYRKILQQASIVYAGGMGPILASKILGHPLLERTPTPDFIDHIFAAAIRKGWSFYLLGGEEEVVRKAAENLQKKFPKLQIVGYHHGFFKKSDAIIKKINLLKPDIILVGMGTPLQEKWIKHYKNRINAHVFWAVGALFDVLSGKRKRAPKWFQKLGLEWTFRFLQEPRRLWKRYLFGNAHFLLTVFRERASSSRKSSR